MGRKIIPAVESWNLESLDWLLNPPDETAYNQIKSDFEGMEEARDVLGQQLPFLKAVSAVRANMGDLELWCGGKWPVVQKNLEDSDVSTFIFYVAGDWTNDQ